MSDTEYQHITIEDRGRALAYAAFGPMRGSDTITASMQVEAGHLPTHTRTRLVDAVVDRAVALPGTRLEASLPAGDGEILGRLRERCSDVNVRAAGATCLMGGTLPLG